MRNYETAYKHSVVVSLTVEDLLKIKVQQVQQCRLHETNSYDFRRRHAIKDRLIEMRKSMDGDGCGGGGGSVRDYCRLGECRTRENLTSALAVMLAMKTFNGAIVVEEKKRVELKSNSIVFCHEVRKFEDEALRDNGRNQWQCGRLVMGGVTRCPLTTRGKKKSPTLSM
ncbi:hypothetical protein DICVIV_07312 [Dictyocaulus viviparus]|uniref:Uncharacterized protein n=1 Tax=Dictyocaulus viviparus TaxID=29172 RepID=A0A0D8XS74_DICVI|nr:hypothetical protein DICVIV_07312 [Dictyocaulus viviparus]